MISLIAAMDRRRAIGKKGALPWRLPADLAYFKKVTAGHPVVMGRKTFESIGRPLPGRINIVITRNSDWSVPNVLRALDLDEAIEMSRKVYGGDEIFIIGGGEIFKEVISLADKLYVTEVAAEVDGADTFFPEIDDRKWKETKREEFPADDNNEYGYSFVVYNKKS